MFCPKCRQEVEVRYGYCTQCGEPVAEEVNKTAPAAPQKGGTAFDPGVQKSPGSGAKGSTAFDPGVQQPPEPGAGGSTTFDPGTQRPPDSPTKSTTTFDPGTQKAPSVPDERTVRQGTVFDPGVQVGARPSADPSREPGRRLVGWLVTFSHLASGQDYRLFEGRNVIGSDPQQTSITVVEDPHVSGKHAVVMFREGQFLLRDADSANGTFVNDEDIFGEGAVVVEKGDEIRCGSTRFVLYVVD